MKTRRKARGKERGRAKGGFTPDPAFRGPGEDETLMMFFDWLRYVKHPAAGMTIHVANEASGRVTAAALKRRYRMGVRAGYPDVLVDFPSRGWHGARFELKVGAGVFSEAQLDWIARLRERGYYADGVRGLEQLIRSWKWYVGISEDLP